MYTFKIAAVAFSLLGGAYATVFAQFCDDTQCKVNCGEAVDTTNTGCLAEAGRFSVLFHNSGLNDNGEGNALVFYSDSFCANDVECADGFVADSGCKDLTGNQDALSFQFAPSGACDSSGPPAGGPGGPP